MVASKAVSPALFRFADVSLEGRLDGLSVEIDEGCITMITGPSGAGKSSLLRLANGLDRPTSGEVSFRGAAVGSLNPRGHRRMVALVFQQPIMFAGSVADNIAAGEPTRPVNDLLKQAGLDESFASREARELSGGEKQRVALARSLGTDPDVLLLDEPTSALDDESASRIEASTKTFVHDGGSVVWVSHDTAQVQRMADRVVTMTDGRLA